LFALHAFGEIRPLNPLSGGGTEKIVSHASCPKTMLGKVGLTMLVIGLEPRLKWHLRRAEELWLSGEDGGPEPTTNVGAAHSEPKTTKGSRRCAVESNHFPSATRPIKSLRSSRAREKRLRLCSTAKGREGAVGSNLQRPQSVAPASQQEGDRVLGEYPGVNPQPGLREGTPREARGVRPPCFFFLKKTGFGGKRRRNGT